MIIDTVDSVEELRVILPFADTPTKKYFVKNHPAAIAYAKQKAQNKKVP